MAEGRSGVVGFIGGIWGFINKLKSFVGTLVFLFLAIIVLMAIFSPKDLPTVPEGGALVIAPSGLLVEQLTEVDPVQQLMDEASGGAAAETAVGDIVDAIDLAAEDDRISMMVLALDSLAIPSAYTSKSYEIAKAVDRFKATDKKVIAVGAQYTQEDYLIASHADEIWLHELGGVFVFGYDRYRSYYRKLLENLRINFHIFRAGEFKSAFEPLTRDDMSEEAKVSNLVYLDDAWAEYTSHVEGQRGLPAGSIQNNIETLSERLRAANGDSAVAALNAGYVDSLKSRTGMNADLVDMVGEDEESHHYKQINMYDYLSIARSPTVDGAADNVAVIVAKGNIVNGEAPEGTIGGDSVARLVRQARLDEATKAIVLRVDSGGGSAFASEIIREEILLAKAADIPVVASMGSLAASGGYAISMSADEIWAAPTTITGSIGVLAAFPTFENTAEWAGVYADGVGTTPLAGAFNPLLPINPLIEDFVQQGVEEFYDKFISIVAQERGLEKSRVAEIAEGRVWSGSDALDLGLVDKLGDFEDAIQSAAVMAGLEEYDVVEIKKEASPFEKFVQDLTGQARVTLGLEPKTQFESPVLNELRSRFVRDLEPLLRMNDPNNIYMICEYCEVN